MRFVNLSISEINRRFLDVSRKWHTNADVWWCILSFEASIMNHDNVWFATTNNGYPDCQRDRLEQGFNALFAPRILRKKAGFNGPWFANRGVRPPHLATCEQAEVLYPERVSLEHLKVVYVEKVDHHDAVVGWLDEFGYSNVRVVVGLQKFQGRQN